MQKITFSIFVRKIDRKIVKNNKFIIIKLFFNNIVVKQFVKSIIIIKVYIIDNFETNFLVDNNILISKNISIDLKNRKLIINNCKNLEIFI